jgi:hypothetical protein
VAIPELLLSGSDQVAGIQRECQVPRESQSCTTMITAAFESGSST